MSEKTLKFNDIITNLYLMRKNFISLKNQYTYYQ